MHPLEPFKYCPKCGSSQFLENNFKSKKCHSCGFVYYFNVSSSVAVIIKNEKNEILVATRAHEPAKGTFDLPGGFIDMDETAEEAAAREILEETGLSVIETKYLFSLPNKYVYSDFEVQTMDLFFECKVKGGTAIHAEDDVAALQFIPLKDLDPERFGLWSIKKAIQKLKDSEVVKS
ncbi:MAG: DNA mismatch repair protein MutT [Bacteroidales bacterium 45-6]|nr:MAG: DNA mismatch repair protein MutT [Bacteroidales bacterium 45-6]